MDAIHDMAGMRGFGAIEVERDEPVFHARWQARTVSLLLYCAEGLKLLNADQYRHAVERMDPVHYLSVHYYERMLTGLLTLLVEHGVFTRAELEARAGGPVPLSQPVAADPVVPSPPQPAARFAVGDAVQARNISPAGHIRMPRYVRGKQGTVLAVVPAFNLPDVSAHGNLRRPEHTYHVAFAASDLWPDADAGHTVVVDLWDSYLEPAA